MKLSIILPVYNEEKTVLQILERINAVNLPTGFEKEVIIIDDASTDKTSLLLNNDMGDGVLMIKHSYNQGKGSSVIEGLQQATGDVVVIQDADLEYNPNDYNILLLPIIEGLADVVYGSRFLGSHSRKVTSLWHRFCNQILTLISNIFTNLTLSDMETCYKMFTREVVDDLKNKLISKRFGIEPELTARVKKYRLYEVPISYTGRSLTDGKKITWIDGIAAVWHILRFNLWRN